MTVDMNQVDEQIKRRFEGPATSETVLIPLEQIRANPYQVRLSEDPEGVAKIAASIEAVGLLQIPTARRVGDHYELAFGHTRYAAYTALVAQGKAQYGRMPLMVRELSDAQMFEMAVAENVQRRDLSPIEEAQAMRRALDEFQYTSAQVGELFGVSAETVRGKIRLLGLPKAVQAQVQSGELNEGVTRALISAGKVMTPEQVKDMGKYLANGMYETEEAGEYIASELEEKLHEMWARYDKDEEPRGGRGLWPLTWNHTGLPPMTPGAVVKQLKLAMKPEQIAGLVEALNAGMDFSGAVSDDPEALQKIRLLVDPPACTDCPLYVRLNGSHFCGLQACWERKQRAWAQVEFNRAVHELGIPAYVNEKTDGAYRKPDWQSRVEFAKLVKAKDPDLRLMAKAKAGYSADEISGSYFAEVVDINARRVAAGKKRNQPRSYSPGSTVSAADRKKDEEARARREQLHAAAEKFTEQAGAVFAQAFKPLTNTAVLWVLYTRASEFYGMDPRKPKKATAADFRERLAKALLTEEIGEPVVDLDELEKGPVAVAKHLAGVAKEWGVKLPADWMERAEGMMPPAAEKAPNTKATKGTKGKSKGKKS